MRAAVLPNLPVQSAAVCDRLPERLVVEGFRRWMAGYATGELSHWEDTWNLYAVSLGPRGARQLVDPLARFVRIVRDWSRCPIACVPRSCGYVCQYECFALAAVAASQHGDIDCLVASMRHLLDPGGHEAAMLPALAYADAMTEHGLMLMPMSRNVLEEIAGRPQDQRLH